ncbi:hypothetical protein FQA39_LY01535 [Lamprigera yunnana]|nr:hypothetical protein FQA39_LY01535 [Lamprigera yunnana]
MDCEKEEDRDSVISDSCWDPQHHTESRKWLLRDTSYKKPFPLISETKSEYQCPAEDDRQYKGVSEATVHVVTTFSYWKVCKFSFGELLVMLIVITVVVNPMYREYMNGIRRTREKMRAVEEVTNEIIEEYRKPPSIQPYCSEYDSNYYIDDYDPHKKRSPNTEVSNSVSIVD